MTDSKTIKKMMLWNTIGTFAYVILQWLINIIVTKMAGYEAAGLFAIATACAGVFFSISLFGVRQYQITDLNEVYSDSIYVTHRVIFCILSFIGGTVYAIAVQRETTQIICTIMFLAFRILESYLDVLQGVQQKFWRMDITGISYISRGVLSLIFFTVVLSITQNLALAILAMVVATLLVILFYDLPHTKAMSNLKLEINASKLMGLTKSCVPLMIFLLATYIIPYVPRQVGKELLGDSTLGIYVSIATPLLAVQLAALMIFNPLMPLFTDSFQKKQHKVFYKLLWVCIGAVVVVTAAGIIASEWLGELFLRILFDETAAAYAHSLNAIVVCSTLTALRSLFTYILISLRKMKAIIIASLIGCVAVELGSVPLIGAFGMNGISYVTLISLSIQCIMTGIVLVSEIHKNKKGV